MALLLIFSLGIVLVTNLTSAHRRVAFGVTPIQMRYPWHTQTRLFIRFNETHSNGCTGTIIHRLFVLTNAHCIAHVGPENVDVYYGSYNRTSLLLLRATLLLVYDNWQTNIIDIGLIKVNRVFNENFVVPRLLWSSDEQIPDYVRTGIGMAMTCGWGDDELNQHTNKLMCMVFGRNITSMPQFPPYIWNVEGLLVDQQNNFWMSVCEVSVTFLLESIFF